MNDIQRARAKRRAAQPDETAQQKWDRRLYLLAITAATCAYFAFLKRVGAAVFHFLAL